MLHYCWNGIFIADKCTHYYALAKEKDSSFVIRLSAERSSLSVIVINQGSIMKHFRVVFITENFYIQTFLGHFFCVEMPECFVMNFL